MIMENPHLAISTDERLVSTDINLLTEISKRNTIFELRQIFEEINTQKIKLLVIVVITS